MLGNSNEQYIGWILDLKQKIQQSQIRAGIQVNSALIKMYWHLGKEIAERNFENTYGSVFLSQLSKDLCTAFPEIPGFSESNLQYCKQLYHFYNQENTSRQKVVDNFKQNLLLVPWRHYVEILTKCRNLEEAHLH